MNLIVFLFMNLNLSKKSQLNNFIAYDRGTFNADRVFPYCVSLYRLGEIAAKFDSDLTPE